MEDWGVVRSFTDQMKNTSSVLEKKEILKSATPFVKKLLHYTYNPYKKYNITSKNCKKYKNLKKGFINITIFELLDQLHDRLFTGHEAIQHVNAYIELYKEHSDLIFSVIDRNMEIRASEAIVNSIFPDLIPTFSVSLANSYEPKLCDFEDIWYASRKIDGVRCIVHKRDECIVAYSRQGHEFKTLQKLLDDLIKVPGNFVLDGEVCLMNDDGTENFQSIMKEIKKKDHTIQNPSYIIFDYLTIEEFEQKISTRIFSKRISELSKIPILNSRIQILDQVIITGTDHLMELIDSADTKGYEGIMLRKDTYYEGKRTKNLLKCKKFFEKEYMVQNIDFDNHRIIRNGKEIVIQMLAQVWIEHNGCKVAVGSGWNQDQRIHYHNNPDQLIGKIITVRYFEETQNQNGGYSLRFPTVKCVHGETRDT